jgi:hypothetical protein
MPDVGCICDTGWSSLGDFSFIGDSPGCQMNFEGVKIISYVCIILPSITNILIIYHYVKLAKRLKTYYVISREFKTLFPLCFLIAGTCSTVTGILKVSYPEGKEPLIGRDVSISFIVFILMSGVFFGLVLYLHVIIQFLKGYSRMMSKESRERVSQKLNSLGFYSWFLPPFTLVFAIMPLISTAYPSQSKQLGMTYLIGFAIIAIVYAQITINCMSFLLKELNVYINNLQDKTSEDIQLVVKRLNAAYMIILSSSTVFGILLIIFASSDYLFYLMTYFLILMYATVPAQTYILVITVASVSHSDNKQIVPTIPDDKA